MRNAFLDGFQIHDSVHNPNGVYLAEGVAGIDFPDVRYSGTDRAGRSGHITRSTRYGGRQLFWKGFIESESVSAYNAMRRALLGKLALLTDYSGRPVTKRLELTTDDGLELFTNVTLSGKPDLPDDNVLYSEFNLPLFSASPQLFGTTAISVSTTRPNGTGYLMPKLMPVLMGATTGGSVIVNNPGTTYSWPTITLTGVHTNPIIRNGLTGRFLQLNITTSSTDTIIIDTENESISLNNSQALINEKTDDSDFWWIEPGDNPILFSSGDTTDTGLMTLTVYPGYIGY